MKVPTSRPSRARELKRSQPRGPAQYIGSRPSRARELKRDDLIGPEFQYNVAPLAGA